MILSTLTAQILTIDPSHTEAAPGQNQGYPDAHADTSYSTDSFSKEFSTSWHLSLKSLLGTQSSLNEVIQNVAATKAFKVKQSQCFLYVTSDTVKKLIPSLLDVKNFPPGDGKPKSM